MSYDPGSPYPSPMGSGSNQVALSKVGGPAIGLMVTGGIMILLGLIGVVQAAMGPAPPPPEVQNDPNAMQFYDAMASVSGPVGIAMGLLGAVIGAVVVFGGLKMKNLQSRGLAMTASVLALIPCFGCCLLGIPVGIWSIVTLNNAEVKAAYR